MHTPLLPAQQKAFDFLSNQHLLHLATLNDVNHPEVSTVIYKCIDNFHILFSARSESRKMNNLRHCAHIGFSVTNEQNQLTVQGEGTAAIISDPAKIGLLLTHLAGVGTEAAAEHWPPPVMKIKDGTYQIVEITPTWLRMGDFRDKQADGKSYFEQIIG